ncbi:MAG: Pvc16 family protein [Anaerolineae bacterium]|nr:Pvc16 family protein [Anaerolineae bacterium]
MLADLDETIRQLLIAELPVKNGELDISFDHPKRDWSSRISKPTVNLFLYDVRENNVLRQNQWERVGNAGRDGVARAKRTPVRVDCSYIVTAWAADTEDEHRLLTRCMLALFRFPALPARLLVGTLRNPPFDIQARLAQHDVLEDPSDLWNVLDNEMRPSISYVITLALDPWQEITGPAVQTRILRFGQAQRLPDVRTLEPDATRTDLILIAGTVRDRKTHAAQAGVDVAIKGTGYVTQTDREGRYALGSIPPGEITLVVWPSEGKPIQQQVTVPSKAGDYDMEV